MSQLKIVLIVATAVVLQSTLRNVWAPLVYIDFPLIVAVYVALQRDAIKAVLVGCFAGLATDALSAGLLGSNGFSKTLTAYVVAALSTQVMLDNPLARIPVLAGAAMLDTAIFFLLHRISGQPLDHLFSETMAYKLICTTVVGTVAFVALNEFFSERARQRRQLAFRRRIARRTTGRRRQ